MKNLRVRLIEYIVIIILMAAGCSNDSFQERMAEQAACIPPAYILTQSLNPVEENYMQVDINKPIDEISKYYIDLLMPIDAKDSFSVDNINGIWRIQEYPKGESGKMFDCSDSINRFTKETGCIFLHMKDDEETAIEYIWNLGELTPSCSSLLEQ